MGLEAACLTSAGVVSTARVLDPVLLFTWLPRAARSALVIENSGWRENWAQVETGGDPKKRSSKRPLANDRQRAQLVVATDSQP